MTADNNNTAWIASGAPATRLVLLRHGVTEYSLARRFAGRSDLDLLPRGVEQAERAAVRISELGPIDAVLCSPLRRTRQTAAIATAGSDLPITIEDGLVETDYGAWDGYTFDELRQTEPDALERWLSDPDVAPPGGESQRTVTERVLAARDRIVSSHTGSTVLLVSHVSPIKALVVDALSAPDSAVHRMFLAPASISVIDYFADGAVSLRAYNETAHLGTS